MQRRQHPLPVNPERGARAHVIRWSVRQHTVGQRRAVGDLQQSLRDAEQVMTERQVAPGAIGDFGGQSRVRHLWHDLNRGPDEQV